MAYNKLAEYSNLLVKQTKKNWLQEMCCGCEGKTEFKVATEEAPKTNVMYINEQSSCCIRMCCGTQRPFNMKMYSGPDASHPMMLHMDKPFTCCLPGPGKCCCLHSISVSDGSVTLGRAQEAFYCCVPTIDLYADDGKIYTLEKGGMCPCVIIECCRQPFEIKDNSGSTVGSVTKKFGGLFKEAFTDADTFLVKFPADADPTKRAVIMASVMLLNQLFFENQKPEEPPPPDGAPPMSEEMVR